MHRKHWETTIAAPRDIVWRTMIEPATYQDWTAAFMEGSRYEGSWAQGERIRFLSPSGEGMLAEVAENRQHEFISLRHIGMVDKNGVEDTTSDAVKAWTPAFENYTFSDEAGGTRLAVDMDVAPDWEQMFEQAWPKALARLKALSEQAVGR
jgi:uncharacterized protein YndB with AHSA1/START domain